MKFQIIASATICFSSVLGFRSSLEKSSFNFGQCDLNSNSCADSTVDGCCSPKLGLFLFSLQWVDNTGANDKFTIHGFWPDYCDGKPGPRNGCDSSRKYPEFTKKLPQLNSTLYDQLNESWPSYSGNNPSFWSHEWSKHGTCVSTIEPRCFENYKEYDDVQNYFKLVLKLYQKFDVYKALAESNIKPGRAYSKEAILSSLEKGLGQKVAITCRGNRLREVRLWFKAKGRENYIPNEPKFSSCPKMVNFPVKVVGKAVKPVNTVDQIKKPQVPFVMYSYTKKVIKLNGNML